MTKVEVRNAIFSMQSFKALGPDGFQSLIFKHFWDVVGEDFWKYVMKSFSSGYIDDKIAETLLVLIPKENNPTRLKNFQPISLCNVIFKVITMVLVNRIRPFLDDLIGPFQSNFIPGRGTTDNVILAQEVVHHMHTSHSKKGMLAFKIDLEKAYPRLDWNFLELTLKEFNFPTPTVSLIMNCVKATNLSILWNGAKTDKFKPSRGLPQGDPLSSYLFVLCMEKLALSIQSKAQQGSWRPVHLSHKGPGLSHLLFADDVLLFCEATPDQTKVVMDTLNEFFYCFWHENKCPKV